MKGKYKVIIAIVVILVVSSITYYSITYHRGSPKEVYIKGYVYIGKDPFQIIFYNGNVYSKNVYTAQVHNRSFTIVLPNNKCYNVTIYTSMSSWTFINDPIYINSKTKHYTLNLTLKYLARDHCLLYNNNSSQQNVSITQTSNASESNGSITVTITIPNTNYNNNYPGS
ncbi:MAG: hypothetical protein F7B11_02765 [Caldisphaeraceae archaeon]|nr:hypothetical protein [Caldisphaeraceae archaeon]